MGKSSLETFKGISKKILYVGIMAIVMEITSRCASTKAKINTILTEEESLKDIKQTELPSDKENEKRPEKNPATMTYQISEPVSETEKTPVINVDGVEIPEPTREEIQEKLSLERAYPDLPKFAEIDKLVNQEIIDPNEFAKKIKDLFKDSKQIMENGKPGFYYEGFLIFLNNNITLREILLEIKDPRQMTTPVKIFSFSSNEHHDNDGNYNEKYYRCIKRVNDDQMESYSLSQDSKPRVFDKQLMAPVSHENSKAMAFMYRCNDTSYIFEGLNPNGAKETFNLFAITKYDLNGQSKTETGSTLKSEGKSTRCFKKDEKNEYKEITPECPRTQLW